MRAGPGGFLEPGPARPILRDCDLQLGGAKLRKFRRESARRARAITQQVQNPAPMLVAKRGKNGFLVVSGYVIFL